MTTWKKISGFDGPRTLYQERGNSPDNLGRFCVQPLNQEESEKIVHVLGRAFKACLPGSAVSAFRFTLQSSLPHENAEGDSREKTLLRELSRTLPELRLSSAASFPLHGRAKKFGGCLIRAEDLRFGSATRLFSEQLALATLLYGETIDLEIQVEWGKGELPAAPPPGEPRKKGWTYLPRLYTPVRSFRFEQIEGDLPSISSQRHLLIEILTDGSISPEDALRRAFRFVPLQPHRRPTQSDASFLNAV